MTAEEVSAEHLMNSNCSRLAFLSAESSPRVVVIVCTLRDQQPPGLILVGEAPDPKLIAIDVGP